MTVALSTSSNSGSSSSNCATNSDVVTTKFVILGAGIAGLQCAAKLLSFYDSNSNNRQKRSDGNDNDNDNDNVSDSNDDDPTDGGGGNYGSVLLLLEARNRIGGRIYTTTEEVDGDAASNDNYDDNDDDDTTNKKEFPRDHGASWVHGIGGERRRKRIIREEVEEDNNDDDDDDNDVDDEEEVEELNVVNPMVELVQRAAAAEAKAEAIKNDEGVEKKREEEDDDDDDDIGVGEEIPIKSRRTIPTPILTKLIPIYDGNPWTRPNAILHRTNDQHKLVLLMDGKRVKFVDGNKNKDNNNHNNNHGDSSSGSSAGKCHSSDNYNNDDNDDDINNTVIDYNCMISQYFDLKRRIVQEIEMYNVSETVLSRISIDDILSKILLPVSLHFNANNYNCNGGNDSNDNDNDNSRRISQQQQQKDQLLFIRQQRQALIVPLFYFFLFCNNWNGQSSGDLQADSMTTNTATTTTPAATGVTSPASAKENEKEEISNSSSNKNNSYSISSCNSNTDCTIGTDIDDEINGGGDGDFWGPHCKVSTGMGTLLHPLVNDVGLEKIRLNQPVTKVQYINNNNKKMIHVETANGLIVHAEYCICTIPLGCLQRSSNIGIADDDENDDDRNNDGNVNIDVDVNDNVNVNEEQQGKIEPPSHSRLKFVPPLSDEKREAVTSISSGCYKKIFMTYDRIFWDDDCYKDKPLIGLIRSSSLSSISLPSSLTHLPGAPSSSTTSNIGNYLLLNNLWAKNGIPCLEAVLAGRAGKWAISKTDEEIQKEVLEFMADTMLMTKGGDEEKEEDGFIFLKKHLVNCHITRWEEDPYTCGAYSSFHLGTLERHVESLQQPEWDERLWFAGEHTHSEYMGSVHAALFSANRVAESIIQTTTASQSSSSSAAV